MFLFNKSVRNKVNDNRPVHAESDTFVEVNTSQKHEGSQEQIHEFMHSTIGDNIDLFNKVLRLNKTGQLLDELSRVVEYSNRVGSASEQLSSSVQEVADSTLKVAEYTDQTTLKASEGGEKIDKALASLLEVKDSFSIITQVFFDFQKSIDSTKQIVDVIKGIADQTNLLALNASIEAARAGEHGRGFSVVASEVRKLAEGTQKSLDDITKHMQSLFSKMEEIIHQVKKTETQVETGASGAHDAHRTLLEIIEEIKNIGGQTANIAAVSEEQAAATSHIAENINRVISQLNASNISWLNIGGDIQKLSLAVNDIRNRNVSAVGIDLYEKATLQEILIQDHLWWVWRVYNAIYGFGTLKPEEVGDHHKCRLGQWYDAEKDTLPTSVKVKFEKAHETVHNTSREIAVALQKEDTTTIEIKQRILEGASQEVIQHIRGFFTK